MMRWLRSLILSGCLLLLIPAYAEATPPSQEWQCDLSGLLGQLPSPLPNFRYVEDAQVTIEGATLSLRICAPEEEAFTAHHLLQVLVEALPKLSDASGLPLQGRLDRQIVMLPKGSLPPNVDGQIDLQGRVIQLQPESAETTIVHEGAHYWANDRNFAETWMVEGYADYLTEVVTGKRKVLPPGDTRCDETVLSTWGYDPPRTAICGYVVGAAVFRELAQAVDPGRLRAALHDLTDGSRKVTSWNLLAQLQQTTGEDLTGIMNQRVFPADVYAKILRQSQAQQRLQALRERARALEVDLPGEVGAAIAQWDLDTAYFWLGQLEPLLDAAGGVAQRCEQLALACARPWQSLPQRADELAALKARLLDAQGLLDQFATLRETARAQGLELPARLAEAVAALDPQAAGGMGRAQDLLGRSATLAQLCQQAGASCPTGWHDAWGNGDLDGAGADIAEQTRLIGLAQQAERRCGPALETCRALWRSPFQGGRLAEAGQTLERLGQLLDRAPTVAQRCGALASVCQSAWQAALRDKGLAGIEQTLGDLEQLLSRAPALEQRCAGLAGVCRNIWQAALRSEQLPGLAGALDQLDQLMARGHELDQACANAGWPCGQLWRVRFRQSGAQQALRQIDDIKAALPTLARAAGVRDTPASWPDSWLQRFRGPGASDWLGQARQAFAAGDIAGARTYAEQAIAADAAPRLGWLIVGLVGALALAAVALAGMYAVRRAPRAHPRPATRPDEQLLASLLAQPPGGARPARNTRKKAA